MEPKGGSALFKGVCDDLRAVENLRAFSEPQTDRSETLFHVEQFENLIRQSDRSRI